MAKTISEFPTATRRSKYDVDQWFNGEIWELLKGEDFHVPIASFRGSMYNQAAKKGFEIQTSAVNSNGRTALILQATPKADPDAPVAKGRPKKEAAAA